MRKGKRVICKSVFDIIIAFFFFFRHKFNSKEGHLDFTFNKKGGEFKPKDWELLLWNSEHMTTLEIGWSNTLCEDRKPPLREVKSLPVSDQ